MKYRHIDIEYAQSVLDYNPETGLFTRKVSTSNKVKVGDIAASKNCGYIRFSVKNDRLLAHRIAWAMYYGVQPKDLDHINGIKDDNRISNLRECTPSENQYNRLVCKRNTSGYKGVCWDNQKGKWKVRITKNGNCIHIGFYSDINIAAKAYEEAAKIHHGEFARLK